jgi:hypothetical protein
MRGMGQSGLFLRNVKDHRRLPELPGQRHPNPLRFVSGYWSFALLDDLLYRFVFPLLGDSRSRALLAAISLYDGQNLEE